YLGPPPANVDEDVTALGPAELLQTLLKRRNAGLTFWINLGKPTQHAYLARLLRACRKRPCGCRAEQRDELAPPHHSITSSALARSDGGTVRSSVRAVWWLMTNSNFDACTIGRSAGFAPFNMPPI